MLASIAVVALALLLGSTVSVWQAVRATRARHNEANARLEEAKQRARAEGNERKARASEDAATQGEREASAKFYAADMVATQQALNEGDLGLARRYLSVHQPTGPKEDLRGFEWRYFWNQARGQALHRLQAHSNLVYAVAFSPNSRWLASADWDGRVIVWDVPSRSKAHEWPGNGTMAFSVAFSSDGRVLGIGRGNEWSLWDVTSMNDPRLIHRAKAREARIKFIPDSSRFLLGQGVYLYGEDGGFTELWEYAPETKLVRRFPDSGGQVAVSADGKFAVTGRYADQIKRWDVATGALLEEFSYPADLKHIECSPRDEWFLTISGMRRAQSWANHRSAPATLAFNKDSDCWDASVSPDGHLVAVAATDQIVHIFDSSTWVEIASLKGHESEVFCVAFSPDGGLLASGGKDESVLLWRTESLRKTKIISGMEPSMWSPSPALSSDGRYIAFRSTKGRVEVWNLDDQEPILSLDGPMYPLAFSPEGRRLVTLDPTLTVASWNLESRQKEASLPLSDEPTQFRPAVLSPDGRLLAIADIQGVIGVYDLIGRKLATRFRAHPARIFGLAFSPDGRLLASCSLDKTTRLWETKAFRPIAEFQGHKHHVYWVAFSPDGQSIATASIDNKAKIWEVQSQRELATLAGHMAGVVRLAFDPQGKTLATAGDDNKVKLWNLRTYREVAAFPVDAHAEWLSFSADGQKLLMACGGKLNILEAPVPPSEPAPSANLGLIPWSLVPEALKTGTKEKP